MNFECFRLFLSKMHETAYSICGLCGLSGDHSGNKFFNIRFTSFYSIKLERKSSDTTLNNSIFGLCFMYIEREKGVKDLYIAPRNVSKVSTAIVLL